MTLLGIKRDFKPEVPEAAQGLDAKAEDNYITIKTTKEKRLIMLPLKEFILKFSNPNVFRVHRSFVINILKIDQIQSNELKIGQEVIPISESYKEQLLKMLNISPQ
jgi:DNA-binding LytR/AlgR family response regulator